MICDNVNIIKKKQIVLSPILRKNIQLWVDVNDAYEKYIYFLYASLTSTHNRM